MTRPPPVDRFFEAMQVGASREAELLALFTDDAVYVEPFTQMGAPTTHTGREAVRAAFRGAWRTPMPDQRIVLDRVDVDGDDVRVAWTCFAAALPGGKGQGLNRFTLREGRIARLETTLVFGG